MALCLVSHENRPPGSQSRTTLQTSVFFPLSVTSRKVSRRKVSATNLGGHSTSQTLSSLATIWLCSGLAVAVIWVWWAHTQVTCCLSRQSGIHICCQRTSFLSLKENKNMFSTSCCERECFIHSKRRWRVGREEVTDVMIGTRASFGLTWSWLAKSTENSDTLNLWCN